jgi:hypothetical protein
MTHRGTAPFSAILGNSRQFSAILGLVAGLAAWGGGGEAHAQWTRACAPAGRSCSNIPGCNRSPHPTAAASCSSRNRQTWLCNSPAAAQACARSGGSAGGATAPATGAAPATAVTRTPAGGTRPAVPTTVARPATPAAATGVLPCNPRKPTHLQEVGPGGYRLCRAEFARDCAGLSAAYHIYTRESLNCAGRYPPGSNFPDYQRVCEPLNNLRAVYVQQFCNLNIPTCPGGYNRSLCGRP